MMEKAICRSLVTLIMLACCVQAQTLKKVASIDLPGPKVQRFDYLIMDDEDHWLLSAHLGPGILYVGRIGRYDLLLYRSFRRVQAPEEIVGLSEVKN